ncbi:MAG: FHA domain-containing protein [Planctomycetes bacterium]|nr:FHA domain-containing protein [Planctomycetota bacterium]
MTASDDLAASLLLPPVGIFWGDLVGVLRSIPRDNFLAVNPSSFLLELPESARKLPLLPASVRERRTFVEQRLKILAQEDLSGARVHYLAPKGNESVSGTGLTKALVVGRKQGAGVVIDVNTVSKRHAELRVGVRGWSLADLDAANGTFIEGRRMPAGRALPITSGMVVEFSSYRALFLAPEDVYELLATGARVPAMVSDVLLPIPEGRRLRDVVEILQAVDASDLATQSAFLVQVPTEAEDQVLSEPLEAHASNDMTQAISATRIMHLQRSRQVGNARVHVIVPSKSGVTVGRDARVCDVVVDHVSVSKAHCRIMFDKSWGIVDLDTRNGTFLEKERLPAGLRHNLRPGQGVLLSGYRVLFLELKHLLQLVSKVKGNL